jgi:SprA-related family
MINTFQTVQQTLLQANTASGNQSASENEDNTNATDKSTTISESEHTRNAEQGSENKKVNAANSGNNIESELSQAELKQLKELRIRDREVRAHEQAHAAAAGSLAKGSPTFSYQRGPDGQLYAIGGEVQIDTSPVAGDPEATVAKAAKIRRAALAPVQPSQQDRSVAAAASVLEAKARIEIAQKKTEEAAEVINSRFSDESESSNDETTTKEIKSDNDIETQAKCSQCGGQHSASSHSISVMLEKTFQQQVNTEAFAYAIENSKV